MSLLWLLPVLLSFLLLAAHFLHLGMPIAALLALLLPLLLILRRAWVPRLFQTLLVLAALEWLRTGAGLAMQRIDQDRPWIRLAVILGAVTLVTLASALVFHRPSLRRRYRPA